MPGQKAKRVPRKAVEVAVGPKSLDRLSHHNGDGLDRQAHPVWSFALVDHEFDGEWSWRGEDLDQILTFLREMEKLTWLEVEQQMYRPKVAASRRKHHPQPVDTLCSEARQRLADLKLEDLDDLFRFRLDSKGRLWAVRLPQSKVCCLLWWDPDHKVYPLDN